MAPLPQPPQTQNSDQNNYPPSSTGPAARRLDQISIELSSPASSVEDYEDIVSYRRYISDIQDALVQLNNNDEKYKIEPIFSSDIISSLNLNNANFYSTYDTTSEYNFYTNIFEDLMKNTPTAKEAIIPSLYIVGDKINCDFTKNNFYIDLATVYKKLNLIPATAVERNNPRGIPGYSIKIGEYFDEYAKLFKTSLNSQSSELNTDFNNIFTNQNKIYITKQGMNRLFEINENRDLMPFFNNLEFYSNNFGNLPLLFQDSKFTDKFCKYIINITPQFRGQNINILTDIIQDKNIVSQEKSEYLLSYNIDIKQSPGASLDAFLMQSLDNQQPDIVSLGDIIDNNSRINNIIQNAIQFQIFSLKFKQYYESIKQSISDFVDNVPKKPDLFLYQLIKTPVDSGREITTSQTIWMPNLSNIDKISFNDSQIKFQKKYEYKLNAYYFSIKQKLQIESNFISSIPIEVFQILYSDAQAATAEKLSQLNGSPGFQEPMSSFEDAAQGVILSDITNPEEQVQQTTQAQIGQTNICDDVPQTDTQTTETSSTQTSDVTTEEQSEQNTSGENVQNEQQQSISQQIFNKELLKQVLFYYEYTVRQARGRTPVSIFEYTPFIFKRQIFTEIISVSDIPPVYPEVEIDGMIGIDNKILIRLNNSISEIKEKPIIIQPEDVEIFSKNILSQKLKGFDDLMTFDGDDDIKMFQIFRLENHPRRYEDFKNNYVNLSTTVIQTLDKSQCEAQSTTNTYNHASYIDTLEPNKKYYYMFRTIDIHDNISNPSPIYEVEIINSDGTIYPIIKIVDFIKDDHKQITKNMRRFLYIAPNALQRLINQKESGYFIEENGETKIKESASLVKDSLKLGISENSVWNKKYRLKIRSKITGKLVEVDFKFTHKVLENNN